MSVIEVLVVFLCVVIAAWSWLKQYSNAPPAFPGALPIIGHSYKFIGNRKHLWNVLREFQTCSLKMGGICNVWFANHSVYVVTDPEDSLTIANSCLNKPYIYDFAKNYLKNGLVTADESTWKVHRKLINPSFNQLKLNTFINEINVQARLLVSQLASKVEKDPFDVRKFLVNYTLSIVTRTSLGLKTQDQTTIDTGYAEGIGDLFALYSDRLQKVWLHLSYLFDWSSMKRRETILIKKLNNIMDTVIRKRKFELKTNKVSDVYDESTPGKNKPLLDQMLNLAEEQGVFTDEDIRQHLDTLVAAAYDSTSSAMTFILLFIGSELELQERIFNELQEVLEHKDDDLNKQDLPKLVLLEAVIAEALRLYPVTPIIARKLEKDIKLKNYTMRAGNTCAIGVYGLLRHPMWGPDADQFRPERWLNSATLPNHPSLKATFGVGKRNCIGKVYSMGVMKVALAHILRRYHVTGNINNVVSEYNIVLKPVEGHYIRLTLRS